MSGSARLVAAIQVADQGNSLGSVEGTPMLEERIFWIFSHNRHTQRLAAFKQWSSVALRGEQQTLSLSFSLSLSLSLFLSLSLSLSLFTALCPHCSCSDSHVPRVASGACDVVSVLLVTGRLCGKSGCAN